MFHSSTRRPILAALLVFVLVTAATDVQSEADRPRKNAARGIHAHRHSQKKRNARSFAISASSSIEKEMLRDTEAPLPQTGKKHSKRSIAEEKHHQELAKKLLWEREENDLLRQELDAIHELRRQGMLDQSLGEDEEGADYVEEDAGTYENSVDVVEGSVQAQDAVKATENATLNHTGNLTGNKTAVPLSQEEETFDYFDIRSNPNVLLAESRVMKMEGRSVHQYLFDDRSPIIPPSDTTPRKHHAHLSYKDERLRLNSIGRFQDKHHYGIAGGNMSLAGLLLLVIGFGFNLLAPTVLGIGKEMEQSTA